MWHFHRNVVLSVCVQVEKAGSVSRAMPLAACDMVELGLIHSQSLAGSGIPIVMWSLTCTQRGFAWGGAGRGGGRVTAVEGHPTVPFNGWIRCHIKNHSWLGVFLLLSAGTWWQAFSVLGKDNKHLKKNLHYCICPKAYRVIFIWVMEYIFIRISCKLFWHCSDSATSWGYSGSNNMIYDRIVALTEDHLTNVCWHVTYSCSICRKTSASIRQMCPENGNLSFPVFTCLFSMAAKISFAL